MPQITECHSVFVCFSFVIFLFGYFLVVWVFGSSYTVKTYYYYLHNQSHKKECEDVYLLNFLVYKKSMALMTLIS